jgi:hypothetical protein
LSAKKVREAFDTADKWGRGKENLHENITQFHGANEWQTDFLSSSAAQFTKGGVRGATRAIQRGNCDGPGSWFVMSTTRFTKHQAIVSGTRAGRPDGRASLSVGTNNIFFF